MKHLAFLVLLFLFISNVANAQTKPIDFKVIPEKSSLTFKATQNGATVKGAFKKFATTIKFHPSNLEASMVEVTIDINSLSMDYEDARATLHTEEWFNSDIFPLAKLTTERFTQESDNIFNAESVLTIKGLSIPIVLSFTLEQFSDSYALVSGSTTIKRRDFNVGWSDTATVDDAVKVSFTIEADAL
jgi:polyisoprenoid-binding protein YceI